MDLDARGSYSPNSLQQRFIQTDHAKIKLGIMSPQEHAIYAKGGCESIENVKGTLNVAATNDYLQVVIGVMGKGPTDNMCL